MLSRLYEEGFLNYQALLVRYYKELDLSEIELIVLIKVLDMFKTTKKIKSNKIASELKMKKGEVEEALGNLLVKKLYTIATITNDNGMIEERVSLDSLFNKLSDCFKNEEILRVEDQFRDLVSLYERECNRTITPVEYQILEGFVKNDGFSMLDIKNALVDAVKNNKVTLSYVEKVLIKKKNNLLGEAKNTLDTDTKKSLDDAFKLL